jgi:hypothetical protein
LPDLEAGKTAPPQVGLPDLEAGKTAPPQVGLPDLEAGKTAPPQVGLPSQPDPQNRHGNGDNNGPTNKLPPIVTQEVEKPLVDTGGGVRVHPEATKDVMDIDNPWIDGREIGLEDLDDRMFLNYTI